MNWRRIKETVEVRAYQAVKINVKSLELLLILFHKLLQMRVTYLKLIIPRYQ